MRAIVAEIKKERRATAKRLKLLDRMLAKVGSGTKRRTVRRKVSGDRRTKRASAAQAKPAPAPASKRKAAKDADDLAARKRAKAAARRRIASPELDETTGEG